MSDYRYEDYHMSPWNYTDIPDVHPVDLNGQLAWDRIVCRLIAKHRLQQVGKDERDKDGRLRQYYENDKGLCVQVVWIGNNLAQFDIIHVEKRKCNAEVSTL